MFPRPLRREILILLAVKIVLLTTLYFAFFAPHHRPTLGPEAITSRLLGEPS